VTPKRPATRLVQFAGPPAFWQVWVRIVPFSAGAHAGVLGSFVVMRFRDERDPALAYVETIAVQLFVEKASEVRDYEDAFNRLTKKALRAERQLRRGESDHLRGARSPPMTHGLA
jgi:hypothetical protein